MKICLFNLCKNTSVQLDYFRCAVFYETVQILCIKDSIYGIAQSCAVRIVALDFYTACLTTLVS